MQVEGNGVETKEREGRKEGNLVQGTEGETRRERNSREAEEREARREEFGGAKARVRQGPINVASPARSRRCRSR